MKLRTLKKRRRVWYDKIGSVFCPILETEIHFKADGFWHLCNKPNRKPRNVNEQYMKLSLLVFAPNVIKNSTNISKTKREKRKIRGIVKNVIQYELVHQVEKNKQVRVVVQKIGKGKHRFFSIMPHDHKSKHKKSTR